MINIHETQLTILKEQLLAKVDIKDFPDYLNEIEGLVKDNAKGLIASMIAELKNSKVYYIRHGKDKKRLWNQLINTINTTHNTQYKCFAEVEKENKYIISLDTKDKGRNNNDIKTLDELFEGAENENK